MNAPVGLIFFVSPPMQASEVTIIAGQSTAVLGNDRLSSMLIIGVDPALVSQLDINRKNVNYSRI